MNVGVVMGRVRITSVGVSGATSDADTKNSCASSTRFISKNPASSLPPQIVVSVERPLGCCIYAIGHVVNGPLEKITEDANPV